MQGLSTEGQGLGNQYQVPDQRQSAKTVSPDIEWINVKPLMRIPYDVGLISGVIRKVSEIKLDNESKNKLQEGLLEEKEYEKENKSFLIRTSQPVSKKVAKCENKSNSKQLEAKSEENWCNFANSQKIQSLLVRAKARRNKI